MIQIHQKKLQLSSLFPSVNPTKFIMKQLNHAQTVDMNVLLARSPITIKTCNVMNVIPASMFKAGQKHALKNAIQNII